jgi:hypothetical protein
MISLFQETRFFLVKKLGHEGGWRQLNDAGKRWIITEIVFSSIERVLGEVLFTSANYVPSNWGSLQ